MTRGESHTAPAQLRPWLRIGWIVAVAAATGVRVWNALAGPLLRGYDDHGHVAYVLYLDLYRALPWADQGWSYFHPPLHYGLGWLLAQAGSAEVLLRGLALVGSAASLAIAALAARVVRLASPQRPELSLLAFVSVAFLPVYLYTSPMAGNELTASLLGTLGLTWLIANEQRDRPALARDAAVGVVLGLGLLTKSSAGLVLAAAGAALFVRALRRGDWGRAVLRGAVIAGIALLLAAPWYARNVREFGTPFRMSRDNPHVAKLEESQGPGSRTWRDFVSVSPALLSDPDLRADHQLHSVWGSAYAQTWADHRLAWDKLPSREQPRIEQARRIIVWLGLAPTLLVLAGGLLAFRDALRGRRAAVYAPLLVQAAIALAAFAAFNLAAPHYSATKASYLLGLTLPYAAFLARSLESLATGSALSSRLAVAAVLAPAAVGALAGTHAAWLPPLDSHRSMGALRFHFGDLEGARASFEANRGLTIGPRSTWTDNLGAIALLEGLPSRARDLMRVYPPALGQTPFRWNDLAVAAALSGRLERAIAELGVAIEAGAGEVAIANRGAVQAALGRLDAAETDLRAALERDARLAPAWHNLAEVLTRGGRADEAAEAHERAAHAAVSAPLGHPYGIPEGFGQYPAETIGLRLLLWLEGEELKLARAPFRAEDAMPVRTARPTPPEHPHIALVVVDTLRADHLGAYSYPRPTSPRIDALARDGWLFTRTTAPSSWTLPSVASLFTSRTPVEHRMSSWGRTLDRRAVTLVERLSDAGYRTVGVSGNFVHVSEKAGFARGFDDWKTLSFEPAAGEEALLTQKGRGLREPTAAEVNAEVFARLPPAAGPSLFLYVHYMEPHTGYNASEALRAEFARDPEAHAAGPEATSAYVTALVRGDSVAPAGERERLIDLYDAEIASVDAAIGELLDELERRGFARNLVVAIVSDHGEEFSEHGGWFHGLTLHAESLAVPFILYDARHTRPGIVRDEPVDLLDVPTTLLALAGVEPAPGMRGRALLEPGGIAPRPLLAALEPDSLFEDAVGPRRHRRAWLRWPWKLLVDREGRTQVFHLEQDPSESAPIALGDPRVPPQLRAAAATLAAQIGHPPDRRAPRLSEQARRRLRALGYVR